MSALKRFVARVTDVLLPDRAERALARELNSHLTLLEDEYRRRGLSPEEARRAAAHALGGVEQTKELHRDARSFGWFGDVRRDVAYAARMLRRRPVVAAAAILSFGLGIGLNAAVFSVVDWVLVRPLPYASPQQLVRVFTAGTAPATSPAEVTPAEFRMYASAASLRASAAFSTAARVLAASGVEPIHAVVARGDGDLFGTLGILPALGRTFQADEIAAGAPVVVLGHELWQRQFHGDVSVIGAAVTIDGLVHTIVGVVPPNRRYPPEADLWRPLTAREKEGGDRELIMIARLRESIPRANAELATIARAASNGARTAWADEVQRTDVKHVRAALNALLASTVVVLLIVCANVAALMGARASDRAGEMAVRGALGASRRHLILQLMTEGLVTAVAGGLVGLLLGRMTLRLLVAIAPVSVPRLSEIAMDTPVFAATLAVTMLIGVCVGLGPAIRLSRSADTGAFRPGAWNRSTRTSRTRRWLVLGQVALAVMLTVGAGLLARSLRNLVSVNNGFDADHIVVIDLNLRGSETGDSRQLFHALIAAAETLPGVRSAAVSLQLPTQLAGLRAQVRIVGGPEVQSTAILRPITPHYFETLGVPMTAGRGFAATDTATTPSVAIVNAAFVRDILGGAAALGTRLTTPLVKAPLTVVGTVADVTPAGEGDRPALYVSADQVLVGGGFLIVRVQGDPRSALSILASRARDVAPRLPFDRVRPLADLLEPGRAMTRFNTRLITTFAALALLLSAIGVYGLTAGEVAVRWREIAVRIALGASPRRVLWTVIRPCAGIILAGSAAGVAGALAVAPLLASLLHGVDPADRSMIATAPAVLISVSILAALLASARVLRVAPSETLRSE